MKDFDVTIYQTYAAMAYLTIEAESKEAAEDQVKSILDTEGIEIFNPSYDQQSCKIIIE